MYHTDTQLNYYRPTKRFILLWHKISSPNTASCLSSKKKTIEYETAILKRVKSKRIWNQM
ncbi:hypothetical protein Hanom_Chr08g00738451 [Helianthus anomalus]